MQRLGHVSSLDGIRGIAIGAVIGYHFLNLPGGFFGVDVFFVLSGFLITTLLIEEHEKHGRISLRGFYARRTRRLLPALGVLLLFSAVWAWAAPASARPRLEGIAATLVDASNVYRMLGHQLPLELVQNWSLSLEEQFYLVWPALLILLLARGVPLRKLALLLLAAATGVALWRAALVISQGATERVFFGPDTRADGLLLGCALAAARASGSLSPERLRRIARFAPLAVVVLAACLVWMGNLTSFAYTTGFPTVDVCAAVLIAAALSPQSAWLKWRPLVWLGAISYSVYLWQGTSLYFGHTLGGVASAVALGALSWHFVERPFRRPSTPAKEQSAVVPIAE